MNVFKDHQQRTLLGKRHNLRDKRLERSFAALQRCEVGFGIASIIRQRQQFSEQRPIQRRVASIEQGIQLLESCLSAVPVCESRGTLHLIDDWIKCTVGMLRRAEIAQARVRLGRKAVQQRRRQSRFSNASLP